MTLWAFYGFSALTILFSMMVIWLRNPVTSCLSLVASFFAVSALFVLLHAPFLAVIQVLVYTGAILVLFLYVVMLLNLKSYSLRHKYERMFHLFGLLILPILLPFVAKILAQPDRAEVPVPKDFGSVSSTAAILLGPHVVLYEVVSFVLLAGIIGAVVLSTMKKERNS